MQNPICGKCGLEMTPENSRVHPEYFLHDACLPDELKPAPRTKLKDYLGDGVYVDFDGYSLVLTVENGITVLNTIILEPAVYDALVRYVERLKAMVNDKA